MIFHSFLYVYQRVRCPKFWGYPVIQCVFPSDTQRLAKRTGFPVHEDLNMQCDNPWSCPINPLYIIMDYHTHNPWIIHDIVSYKKSAHNPWIIQLILISIIHWLLYDTILIIISQPGWISATAQVRCHHQTSWW